MPFDGPSSPSRAKEMNAVQLTCNAIKAHREVVRFLFASPSLGAEGERVCFREAEVREGGWKLRRVRVAKHSYVMYDKYRRSEKRPIS